MTREERILLIRDLKDSGKTFEEIGNQLKITRQRVQVLYSFDPNMKKITKWNHLYSTFIKDYTENNLSMNRISKKYNCPVSVIKNCLQKNGIKTNIYKIPKNENEQTLNALQLEEVQPVQPSGEVPAITT